MLISLFITESVLAEEIKFWVRDNNGIINVEEVDNDMLFEKEWNNLYKEGKGYTEVFPVKYESKVHKKCTEKTCFNFIINKSVVENTFNLYRSKNYKTPMEDLVEYINVLFTPNSNRQMIESLFENMYAEDITKKDLQKQFILNKYWYPIKIEETSH